MSGISDVTSGLRPRYDPKTHSIEFVESDVRSEGMHTNMNRYGVDGVRHVRELETNAIELLREANNDAIRALERYMAENKRLRDIIERQDNDGLPCACEFDDNGEVKLNCLYHQNMKAEVKRLREENARLRARLDLIERRSHPMDFDSPAYD